MVGRKYEKEPLNRIEIPEACTNFVKHQLALNIPIEIPIRF